MPINIGTSTTSADKVFVGAEPIGEIYIGEELVWASVKEVTITLVAPSGWTLSKTEFTGLFGENSGSITLMRGGQGSLNRQDGTAHTISITSAELSFSDGNPTVGGGLNNMISIPFSFTFPAESGTHNISVSGVTSTSYTRAVTVTQGSNDVNGGTGSSCGGDGSTLQGSFSGVNFNYSVTSGSGTPSATASYSASGFHSGGPSGSLGAASVSSSSIQTSGLTSYPSVAWDTGSGSINVSITLDSASYLNPGSDTSVRVVDFDGDYAFAGFCHCEGRIGEWSDGFGGCGS